MKPSFSYRFSAAGPFSQLLVLLLLSSSAASAGVCDPPSGFEEIVGLAEDKWNEGDLVAADSIYREAFSRMRAASDVSKRKLAHQLSHYAQLLNELDRPEQAQIAVSESLYLYAETSKEKPAEYVFAIVVLAESYELIENFDEAEKIYSMAIEQERDIAERHMSTKNLNNVALGYAGLARINARRGDKNRASKLYLKSKHYYKLCHGNVDTWWGDFRKEYKQIMSSQQ